MIQLIDFIWPYLVGMVIGWVLCGYLARRYLKLSPAQEKSVVVRDTRTVEVDNPIHLKRISDLEARIYQLNSRPPEVIEKETTKTVVVDNPVHLERVVALENQVVELQSREVEEKIIEKRVEVDNPEHLERIEGVQADHRIFLMSKQEEFLLFFLQLNLIQFLLIHQSKILFLQ